MTVSIDRHAVSRLVAPGGVAERDMYRRARLVEADAKLRAPVDTGRLSGSGKTSPSREVAGGWDVVFPVKYAMFVHAGTGVHGPYGRPIRPRRARVLRFQPRGGGVVYTPETQGMRPRPFLALALRRAIE